MRASRGIATVVMAALLAPTGLAAQPVRSTAPATAPGHTPFQGDPMIAGVMAGLGLGFGMSLGMATLGSRVIGPHGGEDPGLEGAVLGFATGLTVGTSLGVHLVARGFGFPARYEEALAGALAGVLLLPALPIDLDQAGWFVSIYALPTVVAAVASAAGSTSRMARPAVRALRTGVGVGLAVGF